MKLFLTVAQFSELEQTMIMQEFHQETASLFKTSIPKVGEWYLLV
jgi:hypothetical protein